VLERRSSRGTGMSLRDCAIDRGERKAGARARRRAPVRDRDIDITVNDGRVFYVGTKMVTQQDTGHSQSCNTKLSP
jgi:hypothetical protein